MKIKANAKINFSLAIRGKRADGYHLIDTVMHSISLFDTVLIEKSDTLTVLCGDLPQEENIAYKAANLFFERTGIRGGAKIEIKKNIPLSAGLGGGSADASAVLCGLDKMYNTKLSDNILCEMAVSLGADVPFFIKGGCMRSEGIGEILTPYPTLKKGYILLSKGDTKPSTKEMYNRLDSQKTVLADTEKVLKCLESNDLDTLSECMYNAFETVWPKSRVKASLLKTDAKIVALTGSGPTWFAVYETKDALHRAKDEIIKQNIPCWCCEPTDTSLIFE